MGAVIQTSRATNVSILVGFQGSGKPWGTGGACTVYAKGSAVEGAFLTTAWHLTVTPAQMVRIEELFNAYSLDG
jgi:hypothetical protein